MCRIEVKDPTELGWRVIIVWECELRHGDAETRLDELYKDICSMKK